MADSWGLSPWGLFPWGGSNEPPPPPNFGTGPVLISGTAPNLGLAADPELSVVMPGSFPA